VVSCAEMAEPIDIPFGLSSRVGPRNHVLDGGPDQGQPGNFKGGKGRPIVKYINSLPWAV